MPLSNCPGMDYHNNANQLRTISPSVPPTHHGIPPADPRIPIPHPSPDMSQMLAPRTPSIKGKEEEKDESNTGGHLMDLAEDESADGTSTHTGKDTGTVPQAPTEEDDRTIPPALNK
jgi:hypothetical protein